MVGNEIGLLGWTHGRRRRIGGVTETGNRTLSVMLHVIKAAILV